MKMYIVCRVVNYDGFDWNWPDSDFITARVFSTFESAENYGEYLAKLEDGSYDSYIIKKIDLNDNSPFDWGIEDNKLLRI